MEPASTPRDGAAVAVAGRVSIVTGGTRGLGAAITERLAMEGAHVTAVYARRTDAAATLAEKLAEAPGSVTLVQADVADPAACRAVVAAVVEEHGSVDHLVNNAGLLVENRAATMTREEWDAAVAVNLSGPFYLAQAVLQPMIERRFGRIVNVSSVTALMGSPVEAGYGAAKAGLFGLSRSLAREVARQGITVNTVVPGVFETEMTNSMAPDAQDAIRKMIPLGRRGDPTELAHAVLFLLDDRASYITGSVVTVDGGLSMGG
jgi:NAD(P)-dependent dehydrogenase (short-subunit alcohol dehydrogenase family)